MKKITLLLSMLLLMLPLLAQEDSNSTSIQGKVTGELILPNKGITTTIIDNANVTFTTVYNDVKDALSGLAEGLQVGGEQVWDILVQQQLIGSIVWLLYLIILIPAAFILKYAISEITSNNHDTIDIYVVLIILFGIITIITIMSFLINMNAGITGFLNPEYGAIQEILELIK